MWTCVSIAPHGWLAMESQGRGVTFLRTLPLFTAHLPCGFQFLLILPHWSLPASWIQPFGCVWSVSCWFQFVFPCCQTVYVLTSPGCHFYVFLVFSSGLQAMCPHPPAVGCRLSGGVASGQGVPDLRDPPQLESRGTGQVQGGLQAHLLLLVMGQHQTVLGWG